jgi:hypothetical protein
MNILESIVNNPSIVQQMANSFNLKTDEAQGAIKHLLPALTKGLANNMSREGGLEGLLGALSSGNHQRYVENPSVLGGEETVQEGNAILGHILGSKDVSRNVAGHAAQKTGLDFGLLKKMLPVLATVVMGYLSKKSSQHDILGQAKGGGLGGDLLGGLAGMLGGGGKKQGNPAMDILGSFLDSNKDGSMVDDILGMAKKFF